MFLTVFPLLCQKIKLLTTIFDLWPFSKIDETNLIFFKIESIFQLQKNNWFDWKTYDRIPHPAKHAQIAQDKWAAVSKSLRLLRGNERSWAIHSDHSEEMSDVSESLISLTKNEQMSDSLKKIWLKNLKSCLNIFYLRLKWANRSFSLISSFFVSDVSESLISLKSNERCERIAHFTHQKWAIVSKSLILLSKNELMSEWLIFLSELLVCSFLDKKQAIRSQIKWANSQPCLKWVL